MKIGAVVCAAGAVMSLASAASAGFGGQTILGPLAPGSAVSGNTIGASDDNDGFFSGDHIFFIWDGGDDVWSLQWPGGDLQVDLIYDNMECDVDLFVYSPGSLDETGDYGIANSGIDTVSLSGAPAGTYYVVVDSTAGAEGAYQINVSEIPAPGTAAVGLLCLAAVGRRRR